MNEPEPTIRFFKDLELKTCGTAGIAIAYANEIHIDEKYRNRPKLLARLIEHEKRHFYYSNQITPQTSIWRKYWIILNNNIWDYFDCIKMQWLYFKIQHGWEKDE
jgi:hypothetical protein